MKERQVGQAARGLRRILCRGFGAQDKELLIERFCFWVVSRGDQQGRKVVQSFQGFRVDFTESCPLVCQNFAEQFLCSFKIALGATGFRQVVEAFGRVGMSGADDRRCLAVTA